VAVVTTGEASRRLQLPCDAPASLRITPLPLKDDFDAESVDLRLGSHFFIPRGHRSPFFCPGETDPESLYQEQFVPVGEYLVIPAHNAVLGSTLEFIKVPYDMSGLILTKSSWARTFVTIETAPWIHPLYRGCLTLEMANVSNTPIIVYPGVKIAQLVLLMCKDAEPPVKDTVKDPYVGPVRPERASLAPPEDSLGDLGIDPMKVLHPFDEYEESIRRHPRYRQQLP
jgi:dCTP deaminase